MASPVDAGRIATNITTATDPWTVNLPASIAAGDLLVLFTRAAGAQSPTTPSGWTLFRQSVDDANDDITQVYWRVADGSEGSTMSFDWSAAAKGCAICWRITGADTTKSPRPIEGQAANVGTTANANPNAASGLDGSRDYLFLVILAMDSETATFTAPSGYSNTVTANSGTAGAVATNCMAAGASRQATVSSEDPAAWTSSAPGAGWTSFTIAIWPAIPPIQNVTPIHVNRAMGLGAQY